MKAEYKDGILRLSFGDSLYDYINYISNRYEVAVAKSRKLKCKWTADYHQELHFYYSIK